MDSDVPSTSEAKCPKGRSSLFYKRGRRSSSSVIGRRNSVEGSSSDHRVEPLDSAHYKPEPGSPEAASGANSVQPLVIDNSANHVQNGVGNLVGMNEFSTGGNCVEDGRIDEDQFGESSFAAEQDEKAKHLDEEHLVMPSQKDEDVESDIEIQDVKVCDICGDAGREDLLAICSRCSDGAEHTYCMREMLDEVPDVDWLCEECKLSEKMEKQKQDPSYILVVNEKSKCLRRSSSSISDASKLDNTDMLVDRSKIKNLVSHHQDLESKRIGNSTEVSAKKQNIESNVVSSAHNPGRTVMSRDNSSKNLDKMRTKQLDAMPSGYPANDSSESVRSPNSNSNHGLKGALMKSKSFSTYNSKPKIKFVDDIPQKRKQSLVAKDRLGKMLGKSFSLKGNSSRINSGEAKVKMLSPRSSNAQELKGFKHSKERSFERKNSIKSDNLPASQVQASVSKYQSRGDVKRVSTSCHVDNRSASFNEPNESDDQKKSQLNSKDGATLGSARLGESTDQGAIIDICLDSAVIASKVRTFEEGLNKDSALKAAIEVAMRKKMEINKRVAEKSDGLLGPKIDSGSGSRDSLSQNFIVSPKVHEGVSAFKNIESRNISVNNYKHLKFYPGESLSSIKESDSRLVLPSNGELLLRMSPIPEHGCVWQGGFEFDGGIRLSGICDGVQAHISTFASRKVAALVRKFPGNVVLTEVPRSCTWPAQFQDQAVKEDNIALYFFAKDLKSYERSYKFLLENMIMNDLALRGNIDGIELLVFPSNRLPTACQRWNMLFYLWGVFRGRRQHCSSYKSTSEENLDTSGLDIVHQDKEGAESMPRDHQAVELQRLDQANVVEQGSVEAENASGNRLISLDQDSVSSQVSKMPDVTIDDTDNSHSFREISQDKVTKCCADLLSPGSKMKEGEGCQEASSGNRDEGKCEKMLQEDKCADALNDRDTRTIDEDAVEKGRGYSDTRSSPKTFVIGDNKKRLHEDDSKAGTCSNSTGVCQEISANVVIGVLDVVSQEGMNKRARLVAGSSMVDHQQASTPVREPSIGSAVNAKFNEANDEKAASVDSGSDGSCFFLAERIQAVKGMSSGQVPSSETNDRMPDVSPDLELGLGTLKKQQGKGVHTSIARIVDEGEMDQDKPPDIVKLNRGEEESTETLSLSLAFPFSAESTAMMQVSNTGRPDEKASLNLFKGLPKE